MKLNKIFFATIASVALMFAACEQPDGPQGPVIDDGQDTTQVVPGDNWEIPADANVPAEAITVAEARAICEKLESGATTGTKYYVKGFVKKLHSKHTQETIAQYGNGQFYMVDEKGAADDFIAYQVYGLNGQKLVSVDQVAVGDYVVVYGELTNYNGTYETVGKGAAYIYYSSNPKIGEAGGNTPGDQPGEKPEGTVGDGTEANPLTVADVLTLNNTKTGNYFVKGVIVGQVAGGATGMSETTAEFAAPFTDKDGTNTNILIADAAGAAFAEVIPVQLPAGHLREALNLIAHAENLGKEVVIYGSLEKYFGKPGVKTITRAFIDGKEIVLEIGDEPTATPATIAEFIAAPVNSTAEGTYYELTGTVKNITNTTYGNFDLCNATDTVYVYGLTKTYLPLVSATKANNDKSFATIGLNDGDNITIRGVRADYNGKVEVLGAYFVKKD